DPFDVLEHLSTVGIREPMVAEHQVVTLLLQQLLGGRAALGRIHLIAILGEEAREERADVAIVIYDKQVLFGHLVEGGQAVRPNERRPPKILPRSKGFAMNRSAP